MSENFPIVKKIVWTAIKNCTKDTVTSYTVKKGIKSPEFEVVVGEKVTKWYLRLHAKGNDKPSHMSLFLYPKDDLELLLIIDFTLFINGKMRKHAEIALRRYSFEFSRKMGHGTSRFYSIAEFAELFDELVLDGNLKIGCEIAITSRVLDQFPVKNFETKFFDDAQKMLECEEFADFELRCNDGQKLKCHKVILAARSPVFQAMLSNDMQEAQEGIVDVPYFDSTMMKEVLRFIYCNRAENLDEISKKLIFAAEYYDLEVLKQVCILSIIRNLKKENVIEVLLIIEKVSGCEIMFKKCVVLVERDYNEITQSQDWKKLSKEMLTKIMIELNELHKIEFIG